MKTSAPAPLETIVRYSSPLAKTKPTASVIWLHGLGADGHDFADIVPALEIPNEQAVRFIFPHAPVQPVTLNNGENMRAWFDIYGLDRHSNIDEVGALRATFSIHQLIEQEIALQIASSRIFLAGFSQGGAVALLAGLQFPKALGGIIALSTFLPQLSRLNLDKKTPNHTTPLFIAHGTDDALIPLAHGLATADELKKLGYSVEWKAYPMAHSVCSEEIVDIGRFVVMHTCSK